MIYLKYYFVRFCLVYRGVEKLARFSYLKKQVSFVLCSILAYIALYYVSRDFTQTILPMNRKTMLVINKTYLFGYLYDLVIFMVLTTIIVFILELSPYKLAQLLLLDLLGFYLVSINIPGGLLLLLSLFIVLYYYLRKDMGLFRYILLYFLSILLVVDILTITSLLLFEARIIPKALLFNQVFLKGRTIWTLIEYVSIVLFVIFAWINLLLYLDKFLGGKFNVYKTLSRYMKQLIKKMKDGVDPINILYGFRGVLLGILFIVLLILYLHSPLHNPGLDPVSVDTYFYWKFFSLADKYGLRNALAMYSMARPAYLIVLYGIYSNMPLQLRNPILLMDILHPIITLSLLVLAVYCVANKYYGPRIAGYSAMLTAVGHACITFIAGGYQANSLALALALLWFYFYPEKPIVFTLLSLLVILIHPWTFSMYSVIILVYYTLVNRLEKKSLFQLYSILFITSIAGEAIDRILSFTSPATTSFKTVYTGIRYTNLPGNWISAFEIWNWGSQANAVILLFSLFAIEYSITSLSLALIAPATLFATPLILYRLVLNIPLEILVAKTMSNINKDISILVLLLAISKTIIIATALTPLNTYPWINILE